MAASPPSLGSPHRKRCDSFFRAAGALLLFGLTFSVAVQPSLAQFVQLVSARKYYTLFLSPGHDGSREPLLREVFLSRFRNFGPTVVLPTYHAELPRQPYLEYRDSIDGRLLRVQKIGNQYWDNIRFPSGRPIELRTDALQRVLPRAPSQKIDFFEDTIQWGGWRPPIEDYWIVVDLGKMYASFRQTPAFGMGGSPPPTFQEFLTNQVVRVLPAGYRVQGSTVWWHFRRISSPEAYTTLHVEWKAWYR
ncbi:hypothetical protein [Verrucomicrobium sp. 3C]|uniref:hypothetical protein n=1 Tax=Verrucomicrobium sp. 3C TaxID=1134055 RepID=UPI00036DA41A|nr:hypothetical protein [Verrucomicrobium sp. 3C]